MLDHELAQRGRHLTAVEGLRPFGAEAFQRLGQRREAERLPLAQPPAVRARVELTGARQPLVDRLEDFEDVGLLGVDRRALAGELDRRPDQCPERGRAEPLQCPDQTGGGPRHPAGGRADVERLLGLGVEVDRDRRQLRPARDAVEAGSGDEEVDQAGLAAGVDHHVAAGAEAGQRTLDRE